MLWDGKLDVSVNPPGWVSEMVSVYVKSPLGPPTLLYTQVAPCSTGRSSFSQELSELESLLGCAVPGNMVGITGPLVELQALMINMPVVRMGSNFRMALMCGRDIAG